MTIDNGKWCSGGQCKDAPTQQYYCESIDPEHFPDGPCNAMSDVDPAGVSPGTTKEPAGKEN